MTVIGMKGLLVLTLGLAMVATSSAVIYKVGDSSGWTILGNINYTDWTSKKNFRVGDTIEFKYPPGIHNVLEVKKSDYDSCSNSTPIATHTSGDDKVVIKSPGHRFFICGVPGHCAAGQKLDVRVLKTPTRSSSAPAPAPAPAAAARSAAAPSPSGGAASASPPASSTDTTPDATTTATTAAPAPNANGAAGVVVGAAGHRAVAAAVALAAVASMVMLH